MVADGLRQQAVLLGTLDHLNILRPVEVGDSQDYGFFSALEYAAGGCLADKIRSGPLSPTEAVSMTRAIASASQYARERGVVPFDLTPRSVLLAEDDLPKLADFRPAGADHADMLRSRTLTPGYSAPEELAPSEGVEQTPCTDVYRIGAVLYAMLTGQPPFFCGGDLFETFRQMLEQAPAPVRQRNAAVPTALEAVCLKCLEKSPMLRYAKPGSLVDTLDKFLGLSQRQA